MNNTVMIESKNYKHTNTYGGRIYASDFAFMSLEGVTERIMTDHRFDLSCEKHTVMIPRTRYVEHHKYRVNH